MRPGPGHSLAAARWLTASVLAIAAVSWLAMAALHGQRIQSGPGGVPLHAAAGHAVHAHGAAAAGIPLGILWIAGWVVMVLAMMLPTALPFLREMARLLGTQPRGPSLLAAGAAAFVLAWTVAGVALLAVASLLAGTLGRLDAVAAYPALPAGAAALFAGAYQFTGLKRACLAACRNPAGMLLAGWRADTPWRAAARVGLYYGAVCVGCCWALMLLGLVVGALSLPVMVATATIMAAERMLPSVRPLIPLQAALCAAVGALLLAGILPPAVGWP